MRGCARIYSNPILRLFQPNSNRWNSKLESLVDSLFRLYFA
jgi:hypothetical protein